MSFDPIGVQGRVPRAVRDELARPRLLERLDAFDGTLVVLVAPGGYGKTTLLAQHARRREGRAVWMSLDEDAADPAALARDLAGAVARVLPTLPLAHWARVSDLGGPTEAQARALARDLSESTTNFDLILDGADALGEAGIVWVAHLLHALEEGHRLLLAGRSEPRLGLASRMARGDALVLGPSDLAFTSDETRARLHGTLSVHDADRAHDRLEGWPVGVALVASGAGSHVTPTDLVRDTLDRLPPAVRDTLSEASVLEVWSEEEAVRHGLALPSGWLREARRAGLPLVPLGHAYRPHALLVEVLDARLRRQADRFTILHARAAELAEREGRDLRALSHRRAFDDLEGALHVAHRVVARAADRWEYPLVRRVLEPFPEHVLPPLLRRLLGHAMIDSGDAARGETLLLELYARGERDAGLLFGLGVLAARAGQTERLLALADEGLALAHDDLDESRLLRLRATALIDLGRWQEAGRVARRAADLALGRHRRVEFANALIVVHRAERRLGHMPDAEAALRRAVAVYTELDMPARALLPQNDLAELLRLQGRNEEALAILDDALPVARREESVVHPLLLETLADVHFGRASFAAAVAPYRESLDLCAHFKHDLLATRVAPRLAECAARAGDAASTSHALMFSRRAAADGTRGADAARWLCEAWEAARQGQPVEAALHFERAASAARGLDDALAARADLHAAACRARTRRLEPADARRWTALIVGPARAAIVPPDEDAWRALAEALLPAGSTAKVRTAPPTPLADLRPVRLDLHTLGVVQAALNDTRMHLPLSKSAEVLVWLALFGPAPRDRIVNDLWNGSDERRHVEYFKVAVRHLRFALSSSPDVTFNPVPFEGGRYRLSERLQVHVDARFALDLTVDATETELRRAIDAYAGPFLPLMEAPWAEQERTRVLDATVLAAFRLAERLERRCDPGAVAAYERVLALDPLQEEAHLRLLRVLEDLGETAAARHAYRRYRRMLLEEWGRAPPDEVARRFDTA